MDSSHSSSDSGDVVVRLKDERHIVIGHRLGTSDPLTDEPFDESQPPLPISQDELTSVLVANAPSERMVTLWLRDFDLRDIDLTSLSTWKNLSRLVFANCDIRKFDLGQLDSVLNSGGEFKLVIYGGLIDARFVIPHINTISSFLARNINAEILDLGPIGSQQFTFLQCNDSSLQKIILPEAPDCNLWSLDLRHNNLEEINLENTVDWPVSVVVLDDNQLRSIDLSPLNGNVEYTDDLYLSLADNKLENIDLSVLQGRKVAELNFYGNPLKELDVSHVTWGEIIEAFNVDPDVRVIGKPDWMLEHEMEERMWEEGNRE